MTTKHYNIFLEDRTLMNGYNEFHSKYNYTLKKIGKRASIFDFQDVAMILFNSLQDKEQPKKDKENGVNNLTLIGKKSNIQKVVKDIKSKGFTLEEIAKK